MAYNSNIHHRRSIRLQGYDYSQAGFYFITICCEDRICRFGKIENDEMILNEFGKIATDDILNELDDEDKMAASSLLSWSNAGSHGVDDDLYVASESEKHLKVFKTIFEKTKHIEHYNMMMGKNSNSDENLILKTV